MPGDGSLDYKSWERLQGLITVSHLGQWLLATCVESHSGLAIPISKQQNAIFVWILPKSSTHPPRSRLPAFGGGCFKVLDALIAMLKPS
jgi:hypothetical protein